MPNGLPARSSDKRIHRVRDGMRAIKKSHVPAHGTKYILRNTVFIKSARIRSHRKHARSSLKTRQKRDLAIGISNTPSAIPMNLPCVSRDIQFTSHLHSLVYSPTITATSARAKLARDPRESRAKIGLIARRRERKESASATARECDYHRRFDFRDSGSSRYRSSIIGEIHRLRL